MTTTQDNTRRDGVRSIDCSAFRIVNDADRPSESFIAELRDDGKLYYINAGLRNQKAFWGMQADESTPVEDFGIRLEIRNGALFGEAVASSKAKYRDGRVRRWQGRQHFYIPLPNNTITDRDQTSQTTKLTATTPETNEQSKDDAGSGSVHGLFGFFMHPDFIGVPLLVGTAKFHGGKWLCHDRTTGRHAEAVTKESAAQWIQAWSKADLIVEGSEYKQNIPVSHPAKE